SRMDDGVVHAHARARTTAPETRNSRYVLSFRKKVSARTFGPSHYFRLFFTMASPGRTQPWAVLIFAGSSRNSETNRTDRSRRQRRWPHSGLETETKAATAAR